LAFRIEKPLYPEVEVLLKQVQLEPMPEQPSGICKVVVEHGVLQGRREII
jgi:hypothetical protein